MTGRDLIIYILENGLEDEMIFEDGRLIGFMSIIDASVQFNVGPATIQAWVDEGVLPGIKIGEKVYIPINAKPKIKNDTVSFLIRLF